MYFTHTFGDVRETPVLTPMVEELNRLDKKNGNKVASVIHDWLKRIKEFHNSTNEQSYREYMRQHIRKDIINRCESLPDNVKSFVRNFLLAKLRLCDNHKLKFRIAESDFIGTVLFTAEPRHFNVIKADIVMLMDSKTGLYNRVFKNRYGKQGYIHPKRYLAGEK